MQLLRNVNIDFIGNRKIGAVISAALIIIGITFLILRGGPNYGIDFKGGATIRLQFEKPFEVGQIREALSVVELGNSEIKKIGTENEVLIRIEQRQDIGDVSEMATAQLAESLSDNPFELREKDTVGPRIGAELRRAAIWAVLAALGLILIYVSWRFQFKFAVGAVIALFHDVIITLGVFALLNLEISLAVVAAFLTIVGYSLNDTIVVFDRIRENMKIMRRENFEKLVNTSINQTLSRTVLTSLTTLIVVLILFFFGGEVIHNFSFALLIGVIIGTYSSIFVASPFVVEWQLRQQKEKVRN